MSKKKSQTSNTGSFMTNTKCDDRDWAKQLFFPIQ